LQGQTWLTFNKTVMDKIVLDPTTLTRFSNLDHQVELCDSSGRPVGWFVPATEHDDYVGYECPLSDEELDQIEKQGGGRRLSDVFRDLESRT
jgi:hypothetical protein